MPALRSSFMSETFLDKFKKRPITSSATAVAGDVEQEYIATFSSLAEFKSILSNPTPSLEITFKFFIFFKNIFIIFFSTSYNSDTEFFKCVEEFRFI